MASRRLFRDTATPRRVFDANSDTWTGDDIGGYFTDGGKIRMNERQVSAAAAAAVAADAGA